MGVITSTANTAVRSARKLTRRRERGRTGAFLVEGPRAIGEALDHLQRLFATERAAAREEALVQRARSRGVPVMLVADDVLGSLSDTVHPQGLVGVATLAQPHLDGVLAGASLLMVCWQVGDPGNAGAVVRTADAAGADAVVLTAGSVDVRNSKAVRASAGSLFHLPVVCDVDVLPALRRCRAAGMQVVAASADGPVDYAVVDLSRPTALVFGNEGRGLDDAVAAAADVVACAPLHRGPRPGFTGHAESLNLAATVAVFAYEAARQRRVREARRDTGPATW